ncbi:MAG TPA: FAD-dependent monooxygenase [Nevskiaceae bacterium]|nr:FAD-dependent monooxygenase [Nevskiaceae bacterium]
MADYDLAIVGGGLVGSSLALALSASGLRLLRLEARAETPPAARWDERCLALNAASQQIFAGLGVWPALAAAAAPITATHIAEQGRFGVARFRAAEAGLEALGWNVPVRHLAAVLAEAAAGCGTLLQPARLAALTEEGNGWRLQIDGPQDEQTVSARLLVAADGAQSAVRELLGLAAQEEDYGQQAIVSAIRPQRGLGGVAYERFLPGGPLAVLPKPEDAEGPAASLVWTLPEHEARAAMGWDDARFLAAAEAAFGERLGRWHRLGARQAWPLRRTLSERIVARRCVLIGNAAQSLHPVAAQGFNLGLRDVAELARRLQGGGDPGDPARLQAYAAARAEDRRRTAGFTDGLVRLFSNRLPGLRGLRHLGLLALDLSPPLKQAVLAQNLGFGPGGRP